MAQLDLASAAPPRAGLAERSPLRHVDMPLLLSAAVLAVFGLMMIYSSTHRSLADFNQNPAYYLKRQVAFLVVAAIALVVSIAVDYRYARIYAPFNPVRVTKCVPPVGRFMPTITGWPAPTWALIHEGSGLRMTTVLCPGMFRAELNIAPLPLNQPG